jgi:hypothetical protein
MDSTSLVIRDIRHLNRMCAISPVIIIKVRVIIIIAVVPSISTAVSAIIDGLRVKAAVIKVI